MTQFWHSLGHGIQWLLEGLVVMGWGPVVLFSIIMAIGAIYWMMLQGRYNRKAKETGGHL
ncbi:MAG: hypothetical protein IPJ76_08795 [Flavobacteriales bacterium]|nr:MAG: hypothetical protein IPJ76_08795 [Flavobacteriales bacterium]